MKQTYEEAVLKTVMWWSDKSFRTPLNQNNGDAPHTLHLLMNMVATEAQSKVSSEKIKIFEDKLIELLMNAKNRHERTLSVDYHPCEKLSMAADAANIDSHCFPCKSSTHIDDNNEVFAKYQYGSPFQKI